jgi:hypothetical protein
LKRELDDKEQQGSGSKHDCGDWFPFKEMFLVYVVWLVVVVTLEMLFPESFAAGSSVVDSNIWWN